MRIALVLLTLVSATVTEAMLLHSIAYHQAGGWGNSSVTFVQFCLWASLPLLLASVVLARAASNKYLSSPVGWKLVSALVIGPFFAYCALLMYGHASPFFLLLGLVAQLVLVFTAWRVSHHAT
jgi:hypothetical protein